MCCYAAAMGAPIRRLSTLSPGESGSSSAVIDIYDEACSGNPQFANLAANCVKASRRHYDGDL